MRPVLLVTVVVWLSATWGSCESIKPVAVLGRCIVKITGDMTLSFPMGIIKVFTTNPSPAVLTFKLKNTSRLEQILPNQQILYRWSRFSFLFFFKVLRHEPARIQEPEQAGQLAHTNWGRRPSERRIWARPYERASRKHTAHQWEEIQLVIRHEAFIKLSGKYFPAVFHDQVLSCPCLFWKTPKTARKHFIKRLRHSALNSLNVLRYVSPH